MKTRNLRYFSPKRLKSFVFRSPTRFLIQIFFIGPKIHCSLCKYMISHHYCSLLLIFRFSAFLWWGAFLAKNCVVPLCRVHIVNMCHEMCQNIYIYIYTKNSLLCGFNGTKITENSSELGERSIQRFYARMYENAVFGTSVFLQKCSSLGTWRVID